MKSVFGDVPDRFTKLGVAPIGWAYSRYGLLGAGLGAGSQGAQAIRRSCAGRFRGRAWKNLA